MVKSGNWRSYHAPYASAREGHQWSVGMRVRNLIPEIFAPVGSLAFGDPSGVSTRQSKGYRKILPLDGSSELTTR